MRCLVRSMGPAGVFDLYTGDRHSDNCNGGRKVRLKNGGLQTVEMGYNPFKGRDNARLKKRKDPLERSGSFLNEKSIVLGPGTMDEPNDPQRNAIGAILGG